MRDSYCFRDGRHNRWREAEPEPEPEPEVSKPKPNNKRKYINTITNICHVFLVIALLIATASSQSVPASPAASDENNAIPHGHNNFGCDCMEYWTCILSGGSPYSYCGNLARDVCCFVPENAEPVGILPTPSRTRCGKKGFDSGHVGDADMAEWPWHVRKSVDNSWIPLVTVANR